MPFCFAPWSNLDISPQGIISPCCKFRHDYYPDPALNINQQGISAYEQSRTLITVREDFQQDRWPRGCERCKIEEENGVASKRQLDYDRWQLHYEQYDIDRGGLLTASVAFGNTCNLACITCGPGSSSRWQREHLQIYNKDVPPNHFYRKGFVDELLEMSPEIIHLDIPGGEPFLSGVTQQQRLLQRLIDQGRAAQIGLHYTTNVTVWPEHRWWDLWSHFREIDLQLSIDGVGPRFEYIRYHADWKTVIHHVQQYLDEERQRPNLRLSVSHTVSAYNIYYVSEFLQWCQDQGLPRPWLCRVHTPVHMRPSVWPEPARKYIISKLIQHPGTEISGWINIMQSDDSQHFAKFQQVTAALDHNRGQDFCTAFPELAEWYRA